MKIEPFTDGHVEALPGPVDVVWGAYTADHWYRLDVTVERVMHTVPPPWLGFEFRGPGIVENVNIGWALRPVCARLGLSVTGLSLVEITAEEYAALAMAHSEED